MEFINNIEAKSVFVSPFDKESDLCDYIECNIKSFANDILGIDFDRYIREYEISKRVRFASRSRRCDFAIFDKNNDIHLVEVKNPKYEYDLDFGLGQLLGYGSASSINGKKPKTLTIVSSKFYGDLYETIKQYNLPIKFIVMNKENYIDSVYKK